MGGGGDELCFLARRNDLSVIYGLFSFSLLKEHCNDEFTAYWTCLDYNNQEFKRCRQLQKKFDACVLQKLVRKSQKLEFGIKLISLSCVGNRQAKDQLSVAEGCIIL